MRVMLLLKKVADYITDNIETVDLTFGENLYINAYPDTPDLIVSVIDLGGYPPNLYFPTREKVVEIKFRASNHSEGSTLGDEILDLFHSKENYNLDSLKILHSYGRTDMNYLYTDSNQRDEFSIELVFLIQK